MEKRTSVIVSTKKLKENNAGQNSKIEAVSINENTKDIEIKKNDKIEELVVGDSSEAKDEDVSEVPEIKEDISGRTLKRLFGGENLEMSASKIARISSPDLDKEETIIDLAKNATAEASIELKSSTFKEELEVQDTPTVKRSEESRLEVSRVMKQYVYDDHGNMYLDCVNGNSHVGHSHPNIAKASDAQIKKIQTCHGFTTKHKHRYVQRLVDSFPEPLSVAYLCSSGNEANDLALRMAREFTGRMDVVVTEGGKHGYTGNLVDISTAFQKNIPGYVRKDWVHVIDLPEEGGGSQGVVKLLETKGKDVACFFHEPLFVSQGVLEAPQDYLCDVYRSVREQGGVVIADESRTGLGRLGSHMWSFMKYGVVPDIVTIGKTLGNGFPLGAVVCSKQISDKLSGYFSSYGGNPVACAIGTSVLDTIAKEQLMSSARMVGRSLSTAFMPIKEKFEVVKEIRGEGLLFAIELVDDKKIRNSDLSLGQDLIVRMKNCGILLDLSEEKSNVVIFSPPMCFNMDNGRTFIKALDQCLGTITQTLKLEEIYLKENVNHQHLPKYRNFLLDENDSYEEMD